MYNSKISFRLYLVLEDESEEVIELQKLLQCLGYFPIDPDISGYCGFITEAAVNKFQEANGFEQAGVVGPLTRELLNKYK